MKYLYIFIDRFLLHIPLNQDIFDSTGYVCDVPDCGEKLPNWNALRRHKLEKHKSDNW